MKKTEVKIQTTSNGNIFANVFWGGIILIAIGLILSHDGFMKGGGFLALIGFLFVIAESMTSKEK